MTIRVLGIMALLSTLALLPMQSARAVTTEALNCTPQYQIVQTFSNQAKWEMCWEPRAGYGYRLTQVIYTPPSGIRRKVLDSMHVAQLFVPYDDNSARFFDISYGTNLAVLTAAECPSGSLLTNSTVCLVHRPAGYLFKNASAGTSAQGDSFAVFGYFGLGNYYYTFQYTFFDDGSIEPAVLASGSLQRYGATSTTGWPIGQPVQMAVNHNHFVIWRLDFDLDRAANNLVEQVDFNGSGTDQRNMTVTPLNTETKTTNNLNGLRFWRVRNTVENNVDGRSISYEIEPSVTDQLRAPESFTQNDFYLTQYRSTEELVDSGLDGFVNGEAVTDVVAWYGVNFHHTPRGEDDFHMPSHSQGFRIRPRDVTITLAASPVNHSPTITNPGAQTSTAGTPISNLTISASDADGDPLTFSDPTNSLPPGLGINSAGVISGTPTTTGNYTVTVNVNDGRGGITSASFPWDVTPGSGSQTQAFSNTAAITIRDNTTAAPYPVNVTVAGMPGKTSKVVAKLTGLTHTYPADLDILLVGSGGQKVIVMSDAGGGTDVNGINLTFDAAAAAAVPQTTAITTGAYYKPTDYAIGAADAFPAPGPAAPYSTAMTAFNGTSPNGTWKLYALDDAGGDTGTIAGGVELTITTIPSGANTTPVITNPGAQTTPVNTSVDLPIVASDADGDALTYTANGLPPGLSINSAGHIIGTTTNNTGNYPTAFVQVDDGRGGTASASFTWTVAASSGGTQTFSNTAAITIRDNNTAAPYPANVTVSGMSGNTSKVVAKLTGLTHTFARDIDILLVGPGGQKAMLMSDAGDTTTISNATVTFDAAAAAAVPQSAAITTGAYYKPTDYAIGAADAFPAPGPAAPYPTNLAVFNGTSPNGTWKLYVLDDAGVDAGQIAGGVELTITTQ